MAITIQILECWGDILEPLDLLLVDFDNLSGQGGLESRRMQPQVTFTPATRGNLKRPKSYSFS